MSVRTLGASSQSRRHGVEFTERARKGGSATVHRFPPRPFPAPPPDVVGWTLPSHPAYREVVERLAAAVLEGWGARPSGSLGLLVERCVDFIMERCEVWSTVHVQLQRDAEDLYVSVRGPASRQAVVGAAGDLDPLVDLGVADSVDVHEVSGGSRLVAQARLPDLEG